MQQGGWFNVNNPSKPNGINVDTGDSEITIAAEDGHMPGAFLNEINNRSSEGANKIKNESSAGTNITKNHQGGGDTGNNP